MTLPKFTRRMALQSGVAFGAAAMLGADVSAQTSGREAEGGIGGTGIVGLLTEFGSVYINGSYVTTDTQTAYSDGLGSLQKSSLRIGDSLTVEAANTATGLVARRIHVTHPVIGVISAIESAGMMIRVNGVAVQLVAGLQGFEIGDRVAVSGLWRGQTVVASSLAPARAAFDLVSGDVFRSGGDTRIGPVQTRGPNIGTAEVGSFATAVGRYDPQSSTMLAERVSLGRFTGAAGALTQLSIEGYLEPVDTAPGLRVAGLGHSLEQNVRFSADVTQRVLLSGPYTGKFAVSRATILPEDQAARRRTLQQIGRAQ